MFTEITDVNDRPTVPARLLYDGECPICTATACRLAPMLGRREVNLEPMPVDPGKRPEEMVLILEDGRRLGGADAVIELAGRIWWGKPLKWAAGIPGVRWALRCGYRWVAKHRMEFYRWKRERIAAWFVADWRRVAMVHFAVEPKVLQPHVPFELDLYRGAAMVSLVAFEQEQFRPALGGRLAGLITGPAANHAFLNVRTYVRHEGGNGIYFLTEWINNRIDLLAGPRVYGLPYRFGRLCYEGDGERRCRVETANGRLAMDIRHGTDYAAPGPGTLDEFLLERYTAFTQRNGVARRFDIEHEPWKQTTAEVRLADTSLLRGAAPYLNQAEIVGAHYSPGVAGVRIGRPRRLSERSKMILWAPLVLPVAAGIWLRHWPAWAYMWVMAWSIYAASKAVTYLSVDRSGASLGRKLSYLLVWPGMDAKVFLDPKRKPGKPSALHWIIATGNTVLGPLLFAFGPRWIPNTHPAIQAWVGMTGLVLALHFGAFHLLALMFQRRGIEARAIMDCPVSATSLADFWSRRWNMGFRDLAHEYVFRPLVRPLGAQWAMLGVFAASGLVHELVISLPARGGWGLPTVYFLWQGIGVLGERKFFGKAPHSWGRRVLTMAWVLGPVGLLFHGPFIERVIVPLLHAAHAL